MIEERERAREREPRWNLAGTKSIERLQSGESEKVVFDEFLVSFGLFLLVLMIWEHFRIEMK